MVVRIVRVVYIVLVSSNSSGSSVVVLIPVGAAAFEVES